MGGHSTSETMRAARVLVVEDSAVARGLMRQWLSAIGEVHVAANGRVALDCAVELSPDVIVLDIEMPVMDGLTALPQLLQRVPDAKVLIVSTLSRRNAEVTLRAMRAGASDFIAKPSSQTAGRGDDSSLTRAAFREELLRKVTALAGCAAKGRSEAASIIADTQHSEPPREHRPIHLRRSSLVAPRIVAFGASTGGPGVLAEIFAAAGLALARVPVVLAQHMPAVFTQMLGEQLASLAGLSGGEARDGQVVVPGQLYVAPGGKHMRLRRKGDAVVVALDEGEEVHHCRPAVDPLFESVAACYGSAALGVVLTGMGSDGAAGARMIADTGGTVFAQDAKSSVVWGMPGATVGAGAAAAILDPKALSARLCAILDGRAAA